MRPPSARALFGGVALALVVACRRDPAPDSEIPDPMLRDLRAFEAGLRADSAQPKADLGPDPYALVVANGVTVGLLRGASAIVLLDRDLRELARASAGPLADALAVTPDGAVLVAGESSGVVRRFMVSRSPSPRIDEMPSIEIAGASGVRALAVHASGKLYALDEASDALFARALDGDGHPTRVTLPAGPFRICVTQHYLVALSLIGHALTVFRLAEDGSLRARETIRHDGPFWGIAVRENNGALEIAAGGVEDHPLDRTGGSFGYIDSFLYLYRTTGPGLEQVSATNVGELGVVTPKALGFLSSGALRVTGYGSDTMLDLTGGFDGTPPSISKLPSLAGVAAIAEVEPGVVVGADPLLDAWVTNTKVVRVPASGQRTAASRLGEALVFTTLMSPWAKTDAALSRFTCETCHFEGITDGRTHHTGRGDVHATTKPLAGLFVNEPHFTRALDEDMAKMISSEFRVAASNTGHSPIFALDDVAGSPGLPSGIRAAFGDGAADLDGSALGLRKALMEFLRDFGPKKNPRTIGRDHFSERERRGADVFHELCEGCHAGRLVANDAHTEVPFENWEREIFSEDRIVWARDGREKTGIVPYVHPDGARPTSLRRLAQKRPYFTNGSSPTVTDVLLRMWLSPDGVLHAREAEPGRGLDDDQVRDLRAFLSLL